jgi:phospholipid/cholesterol/gamma-HCH transport system ATP-binding protein
MEPQQPHIQVENLEMRYGDRVILRDVTFSVNRGEVFVVMGGSGCGKTTLLKHMTGLLAPASGRVLHDGVSFWDSDEVVRQALMRRMGILYQQGALFSSLTLAENVGVPLEEFTELASAEIRDVAALKLALVGLAGYEDYYPSEISGGMRKRAGLARALALNPEILFFDEPSAGLDPVSSRRLDDLILEIREGQGTTVVVVSHELASILAIGTNSVFLDSEARTVIAAGPPAELRDRCPDPRVRRFLNRGEKE